MLFTKASEYALLSVAILAKSDTPRNVEALAKDLNISKSFLAKILQSLAKNNILISHKGANGGFSLEKDAKNISILEIISTVENKPIQVLDCTADINCCPNNPNGCIILPFFNKLQNKIDNFLENLTIEDLIQS